MLIFQGVRMGGGSWWMDQRLIDLIGSSLLVSYNLRIKMVGTYSGKKKVIQVLFTNR